MILFDLLSSEIEPLLGDIRPGTYCVEGEVDVRLVAHISYCYRVLVERCFLFFLLPVGVFYLVNGAIRSRRLAQAFSVTDIIATTYETVTPQYRNSSASFLPGTLWGTLLTGSLAQPHTDVLSFSRRSKIRARDRWL